MKPSYGILNSIIMSSHIQNNHVYVCGGEGYCELLVNFVDFLFIVHAILLFRVQYIYSRNEKRPDSGKHLSLNHDQAHKLVV